MLIETASRQAIVFSIDGRPNLIFYNIFIKVKLDLMLTDNFVNNNQCATETFHVPGLNGNNSGLGARCMTHSVSRVNYH